MYILVTGLQGLWKVIQTLLNKSEGVSNKELVLQAPYYHKVGIQEGLAWQFCQQKTKS